MLFFHLFATLSLTGIVGCLKVTFFVYKKLFFHFYTTDLVNTKTTIPLWVGEQR